METSQSADFNLFKFSVNNYSNRDTCTYAEFKRDLARIRQLNNYFTKFREGEDIHFRLLLNNLVVLNNVFVREHLPTILFSSIDKQNWSELKTLLLFLNLLPIVISELGINTLDIPLNSKLLEDLKNL